MLSMPFRGMMSPCACTCPAAGSTTCFDATRELALNMMNRATQAGIPGDVVPANCGYGEMVELRGVVRLLGVDCGNKQRIRTVKERCKTKRMYKELEGELELDHYEGRSFPG